MWQIREGRSMKPEIYIATPIVDNPIIDNISSSTIVAFFRCSSCLTCEWREKVVDPHPTLTTKQCNSMHREKMYLMPKFLGYSFE